MIFEEVMDIEEIKYVTFTSPEDFSRMDEIFRQESAPVEVLVPKIQIDTHRELAWRNGPGIKGYFEESKDDSLVVAKIEEFKKLYGTLPRSVVGIKFEGDFERRKFCHDVANYLVENNAYFFMMADSGYIAQEEVMRFSEKGRANNQESQLPQILLE